MGQAARGSPAAILAFVLWTRGKVHSFSRLSTAVASLALFCFDCPQSVTADVELQDDAVMYKSVDGQSSSSNLAKQSIVEARGRLIASELLY